MRPRQQKPNSIVQPGWASNPMRLTWLRCTTWTCKTRWDWLFLVGSFNAIWKICLSNWIISPGRDEHKKYLKPPPSVLFEFWTPGKQQVAVYQTINLKPVKPGIQLPKIMVRIPMFSRHFGKNSNIAWRKHVKVPLKLTTCTLNEETTPAKTFKQKLWGWIWSPFQQLQDLKYDFPPIFWGVCFTCKTIYYLALHQFGPSVCWKS